MAECIALGGRNVHSTRWSQILADIAIFAYTPPEFDALIRGGLRQNIAMTFGMKKLE